MDESIVVQSRWGWCRTVGWATGLLLVLWSIVILLLPRMWYVDVNGRSGQVWIHLGWGRTAVFWHSGGEQPSVRATGGGYNETNIPHLFISPRSTHVELPGFEYVAGSYYKTPHSGWGIAVSWFYTALLGVTLLFLTSQVVKCRALFHMCLCGD